MTLCCSLSVDYPEDSWSYSVVEPLGGEAWWEEVRSLGPCLPLHFFLLRHHEVSNLRFPALPSMRCFLTHGFSAVTLKLL